MFDSSVKSLLTLSGVNALSDANASLFSKIVLTASIKSPLCLITALSNLYSLEILSLLITISSIII